MFKPLFKYTFLAFIWKRYKSAILSGFLLLLFILFVIVIHNDYVRYSETAGQQGSLALSFLLKWVMIIGAIFVYWLYVKVLLKVKPKSNSKAVPVSDSSIKEDAFAGIRRKEKLHSKADKIINPDQ